MIELLIFAVGAALGFSVGTASAYVIGERNGRSRAFDEMRIRQIRQDARMESWSEK
jgi:hypothetical protein